MKPSQIISIISLSCLAPAQAASLLIDFENSAGTTETGWQAFTDSGEANNKTMLFAADPAITGSNVSITTTGVEFTRNYNNGGSAPPAFWADDLDSVYNDLILRNDGSTTLNIAIGGLVAGTFDITTYHLVSGNSGSTVTSFDLDVDDADSAGFSQNVGTFSMGKANTVDFFSPTVNTFEVTSNGTDPVTLRLTVDVLGPGGTGNWMGVNGLEIANVAPIPEPSSTALLGLGGLALIMRRSK